MIEKRYKAMEQEIRGAVRYVIVDTLTGQMKDNARGYGFKSKQSAYASYGYKLRKAGKRLLK